MKKIVVAKVLRDKSKAKVVILTCPLVAVYDNDGVLIAIHHSVPKGTTSYQRRLVNKVLDVMNSTIDIYNEMERQYLNKKTIPIPDYIKRAFPDDTELV